MSQPEKTADHRAGMLSWAQGKLHCLWQGEVVDYVGCDIFDATYVKTPDGVLHKIQSKWGVNGRSLEPPSKGGFGCHCTDGVKVNMWEAAAYYKEDPQFSGKRRC